MSFRGLTDVPGRWLLQVHLHEVCSDSQFQGCITLVIQRMKVGTICLRRGIALYPKLEWNLLCSLELMTVLLSLPSKC